MGYNLIWTEENIQDVSETYSYQVARDLEKACKSKEDEIKWIRNMAGLSRRFQDMISLDDLTVAELRFSSMSAEYRALLVVIPEEKVLVYYDTVPKKGSYQEKTLELMRNNSERISETIRKRID